MFIPENIPLAGEAHLHFMSPSRMREARPIMVMERSKMPRRPHLLTVAHSNSQAPPPAHTESRYIQ